MDVIEVHWRRMPPLATRVPRLRPTRPTPPLPRRVRPAPPPPLACGDCRRIDDHRPSEIGCDSLGCGFTTLQAAAAGGLPGARDCQGRTVPDRAVPANTPALGRRHIGSGQGERHRRTTAANISGPEFTWLMGGERRGRPGLGDAHHDHYTKDVRPEGPTSPRPDLLLSSAPPVESTLPCNPAASLTGVS
jgi:hypothetical protein